MAERRSGFLIITIGLMVMAFIIAFFISLTGIGKSGVLYCFALQWELLSGLLLLAAWTPAILLVSAAIVTESFDTSDAFMASAARALMPSMILAVLISIFYLLVVPGITARKNWYESTSALFEDTLRQASMALVSGNLDEADRLLLINRSIDEADVRYLELSERVKRAIIENNVVPDKFDQAVTADSGPVHLVANRFYLEALEAFRTGNFIEAHYLARRSAALYPNRMDTRRLVEESWRALQAKGPGMAEQLARLFYWRKVAGYERFAEGDYLEAYRIFRELADETPDDRDVINYLERSTVGLSNVAFFIDQDEAAFARSILRDFRLSLETAQGWLTLSANGSALSLDGLFFRDLRVERSGAQPLSLTAPYGQLKGSNLIVRAVHRNDPGLVFEPEYLTGEPVASPGLAVRLPMDDDDARLAFTLSGRPEDIPLVTLASGIDAAVRFGLAVIPLRAELASRLAYPFVTVILVLLGMALGFRFRPPEPVARLKAFGWAPVMVALIVPVMDFLGRFGKVLANGFAYLLPGSLFIPVWLIFLGLCTMVALFLAANIAYCDSH
jgi:tetratricopeptide (TPR) repeat protein